MKVARREASPRGKGLWSSVMLTVEVCSQKPIQGVDPWTCVG